jgi:hypothetical protein
MSGTNGKAAPPAGRNHHRTEAEYRAYARNVASQGFALLAHAVNACDNPSTHYRFADAEQEQFIDLCSRLYSLIDSGHLEPRSAAIAQDDIAFQRFVSRSLTAGATQAAGESD